VSRFAIVPVLLALLAAPSLASDRASRRTPVVKAVEKVAPAVVNISTTKRVTRKFASVHYDREMDLFFRRFRPRSETLRSLGSGAIIDPDGFVVTNHHVVNAADTITVTVLDADGNEKSYRATEINSDPANDLALIKIEGGPFPHVEIAEVDDLMIGETVIAMGNPIGLGHTVTTGVLSAKGRSLTVSETVRLDDLLQTDASINPGNSGGPLLDINGRLIGVNTAIVRYLRGTPIEGIGFSLAATKVRAVLDQLVDPAEIGDVTLGFVTRRGTGTKAVVVESVDREGPAGKAGLRVGDRIETLDGEPVRGLFDFRKRILDREAGDTLALVVRRGGRLVPVITKVEKIPPPAAKVVAWERLGAAIALPEESGLKQGLGILGVRRGGPAHRIGVQRGDVLVDLGGRRIESPDDLVEIVEAADSGRPLAIRIWRRNKMFSGKVELD